MVTPQTPITFLFLSNSVMLTMFSSDEDSFIQLWK